MLLRVLATHLGLRPAERRAQVRSLLKALEAETPHPTLLMGRFERVVSVGPSAALAAPPFPEDAIPAQLSRARTAAGAGSHLGRAPRAVAALVGARESRRARGIRPRSSRRRHQAARRALTAAALAARCRRRSYRQISAPPIPSRPHSRMLPIGAGSLAHFCVAAPAPVVSRPSRQRDAAAAPRGSRCARGQSISKGRHMSRTTPAVHAARRWIGLVALASLAATAGSAFAQSEQDQLVRDAQTTFSNFVRNPDMTWFSTSGGRGGAIAPKIVRAGWIFGSSGTRGAVFAVESGRWSGPAFYNVGTASVGFRLGSTSRKPSPGHDRQGLNSLMAVR